jgi:spore germination protein KB
MAAWKSCSWLTEVFAIMLLAPFLNQPERIRSVAVTSTLLTGLSMTWMVTGSIAIFGVRIIPIFDYPTFNVFRIIEVARFLERIDAFYIAVWVGMMVMKVTIMMYFGYYCFCQTLGIRAQKLFLMPYGLLILTFSIVSWETNRDYKFFSTNAVPFYVCIALGLPCILWLLLRLKAGNKKVLS